MTYKELEAFLDASGVDWDVMNARPCGVNKERITIFVEVSHDDSKSGE